MLALKWIFPLYYATLQVVAFCPDFVRNGRSSLTRCFETSAESIPVEKASETPSCHWKTRGNRWEQRINLGDLEVGQQLRGFVVEEHLEGKTGPKLYFECGVGRTNDRGEWSIVNGMLRLDRGKKSVTRKRAARLRKKKEVELYVSRIQSGCGRLEVCATPEDVKEYKAKPKVPVTSLKANQGVKGQIVKLLPYGAIVDVGANRLGLLHIQKVANLYGKYIDKEKGLAKAGLEKGAKLRLSVASNEKRRLFLDFTEDVKKAAAEERANAESAKTKELEARESATISNQNDNGMSAEELAEWAALAQGGEPQQVEQEDPDDDDDDDEDGDTQDGYDEERDIEDALGLGFY